MRLAQNIDEVILALDEIITQCGLHQDRRGYFACLYRKMTIAVRQGILQHAFEDGRRMERLDVVFANRYIQAYIDYSERRIPTESWNCAFQAVGQPYTVIQHLLLGMNAHINLDLGVAAAEISKGSDIRLLQRDFDKINDVIGSLINSVQTDLESICFPMRFLRFVDNNSKDAVINFSISTARKTAWANAVTLSLLPDEAYHNHIGLMDRQVCTVAHNILTPRLSQSMLLKSIQWFEPKNVATIISRLKD